MNKKGFTMVELMVSISIIAIVMVFLVKLLIDAKYDVNNEFYDTTDQVDRAEIIKTIQNDLAPKEIISINSSGSNNNTLVINFVTAEGNNTIAAKKNNNKEELTYTSNSVSKKWTLKTKNKETFIQKTNIKYNVFKNGLNDYVITVNIPIIIDDSKIRNCNDSQMDNIMLTIYGNGSISESGDNAVLNASTTSQQYNCDN